VPAAGPRSRINMSSHVDVLKTELEAEIAALESEARRLEAAEVSCL